MKSKNFLCLLIILLLSIYLSQVVLSQNKSSINQNQMNSGRSQLTDEQKQELKAKVQEMKQAGASQTEIRAAVKQMLQSWGVNPQKHSGQKGKQPAWYSQLTEDQKQQVQAKRQEMRKAGASKEEIKSTVKGMLQGWGVNPQGQSGQKGRRPAWYSQLTEDQKQQVQTKRQEMKKAGASKEEIQSAIKGMLQSWGINPQGQKNQTGIKNQTIQPQK